MGKFILNIHILNMKTGSTILLLICTMLVSDVAAVAGDPNRVPHFSFFIFNDLQFIDFFGGLASGWEGKDVLPDYEKCADGIPIIIDTMWDEITSFGFMDYFKIFNPSFWSE